MKEAEKVAMESLDSILDSNLEDVEDLPEYIDQVPAGYYKMKITKCERKTAEVAKEEGSSEKVTVPVTQVEFEIVECLELADTSKDKDAEGAKPTNRFNVSFFWHKDIEKTKSAFKTLFSEIAPTQGWQNLLDIERGAKGLEVAAKVKSVADKKKDDRYYHRVSNMTLA